MTSFDILVSIIQDIPQNNVLITMIPVVIGALLYFFGKIRISNYWQYHLDQKYSTMFNGLIAMNNIVFVPLIAILFFAKFPFLISWGGLLLVLLFLLDNYWHKVFLKLVRTVAKSKESQMDKVEKLLNFDLEKFFFALKLKILVIAGPVILFLLSYWILILTDSIGVLIIVIILNLLSIIRFVHLDSLAESRKEVDIKIKTKKKPLTNVRIIEFLNEGKFCKIQTIDGVKVIPSESIEEISMD